MQAYSYYLTKKKLINIVEFEFPVTPEEYLAGIMSMVFDLEKYCMEKAMKLDK